MAKLSKVLKNKKRRKTVAKFARKRAELKAIITARASSPEQVQAAYKKIGEMPRDASSTRFVNRCRLTGRPRAFLRKFGLSRIAFRELALLGEVPGVIKSSW